MDGGFLTYPLDQVLGLCADKRGNRHVGPRNPPLCHDGRVLKGSLAYQKLVGQHTKGPQVDLFVVVVVLAARLEHLRGQVVEGAAHGLAAVVGGVDAPAKVGDLELAVDADEDVLGLDVAVDDVLAVQVAQG